jgi:hypothetical protein
MRNPAREKILQLVRQGYSFQLVVCDIAKQKIFSKYFGRMHGRSPDIMECIVLVDTLPLMILDGVKGKTSFKLWTEMNNPSMIDNRQYTDPYHEESIDLYTVLYHQPPTSRKEQILLFNSLLLLKRMNGCKPITPIPLQS